MKVPLSIRARLVWGAALVLLAFLASAGWVVQKAYADSVRTQRFARLQSTIYLLMAGAEINGNGSLVVPAGLAEPRLSLPNSGLYANIANVERGEDWQSLSTLGLDLPFERRASAGQWQFDTVSTAPAQQQRSSAPAGRAFLAVSYGVKWSVSDKAAVLVFSVLEDKAEFDRDLAAFGRTLWGWLGGTGVLLLLTQTLLLRWGLSPLGKMAREIQRIEKGDQTRIEETYPSELVALTHNLNLLIDQERSRQTRYKDALDDLAHSLKTPLAVLQASLDEPGELPSTVAQQVSRMNDIVVHQLGRAAASGAARFALPVALAPVLHRIVDTLAKVYVEKGLTMEVICPPELTWRITEADVFEILGNVLDNAAKWAKLQVTVSAWHEARQLCVRVCDDGPGFADPQAALQRRVRLDEQVPGHGIGLSVVRDLVNSHQGEIRIARSDRGGAQVDIILRAA